MFASICHKNVERGPQAKRCDSTPKRWPQKEAVMKTLHGNCAIDPFQFVSIEEAK